MVWIQTTFTDETLRAGRRYYGMNARQDTKRAGSARCAGSKGYELWPDLDVEPDDLIVEKKRFSAFIQGSPTWPRFCAGAGSTPCLSPAP